MRLLVGIVALLLVTAAGEQNTSDHAFAARARAPVACCPAPVLNAYSALYRFVNRHWVRTHLLHLGDRALLILRFRWMPKPYVNNMGWDCPSAYVIIWKNRLPYRPSAILYESPLMKRSHLPSGFTRFSLEVDIPRNHIWLGPRDVAFDVTNGSGTYGFYLYPKPTILR